MDETTEEVKAKSGRSVFFTALGAMVVVVVTLLYVWGIMYKPAYGSERTSDSAVTVSTVASGEKMYTVHLQIVQQVGVGPHADWLGYQTDTSVPHPGTFFTFPRNSLVTVIIKNFDSQTLPRNPFFTLVQGTVGGVEYVNGKRIKEMIPDVMSHTFTIPDFGVSVPMMGIPSNAAAGSHETMKFTFRTLNKKGVYAWQCIVPCGSGLYGNGGPMSELGYMQGLITLT